MIFASKADGGGQQRCQVKEAEWGWSAEKWRWDYLVGRDDEKGDNDEDEVNDALFKLRKSDAWIWGGGAEDSYLLFVEVEMLHCNAVCVFYRLQPTWQVEYVCSIFFMVYYDWKSCVCLCVFLPVHLLFLIRRRADESRHLETGSGRSN